VNEIFAQVVEGFAHLERNNILHRDIRPANVLVNSQGVVKIIDLGFGKQTSNAEDFGKSITLNWWGMPPAEFAKGVYDHTTEVYFVGKLFDKIISEHGLGEFKHIGLLRRMCASAPLDRIASFAMVRKEILADRFLDVGFEPRELEIYRAFSSAVFAIVSKIERSAKYYDDIADVQSKLEACYKRVMLEEDVPDSAQVLRCLINGSYYYGQREHFSVVVLKDFVDWFRAVPLAKKNIILANIHAKLDAEPRYQEKPEEDIPF